MAGASTVANLARLEHAVNHSFITPAGFWSARRRPAAPKLLLRPGGANGQARGNNAASPVWNQTTANNIPLLRYTMLNNLIKLHRINVLSKHLGFVKPLRLDEDGNVVVEYYCPRVKRLFG
jgi:hypothetical protein